MESPLDIEMNRRKFLLKLYNLVDNCKIQTEYEGNIQGLGDRVTIFETRQVVVIGRSISLLGTSLDQVFRTFLTEVDWIKTNFIAMSICGNQLIWGAI